VTRIATCAYRGSFDPAENLRRHRQHIDQAVALGAELVVFPECSLHGYPDRLARGSAASRARLWAQAEHASAGVFSRQIVEHAVTRSVHVVFGLSERGEQSGTAYNTAVLTGPDGYIGSYRKVHLGASEQAVWRGGDEWPVFTTAIGRLGMLICVDKAFPESTRELALGGADLLVMPSAWAFEVGISAGFQARWAEYYLLFERARAAENSRWFVSSNYAGDLGDTSYGGYSQIVDPLGNVRVSTGTAAGLVSVDIDIAGEIRAAEDGWPGCRLIDNRRPETYRQLRVADPPDSWISRRQEAP
jgi:predicted amidohydrolase